jgi:hypothetical protein
MPGIYKVFGRTSIALLTLLLVMKTGIVQAQDPLFTIEGVKVDVTAESATVAREKAFAQAEQDAFTVLAQRLLPESALGSFTPPDSDTISNMVQDFEVTEERLSPVRYMGTYTFRFRDQDVQRFFSVKGTAYSDVKSRPVLILPFYQWGSRMVLWEGDNPWLNAWNRAQMQSGLVPVTVPIGDAQDVIDISDNQALTYDPAALDSMLLRYDAGDALIAIATPVWPDHVQNVAQHAVPEALSIALYRKGMTGPEFVTQVRISPLPEEQLDGFYARATTEVQKTLQQDWKTRTVAAPQQSVSQLQARVRIRSMADWVEMQNALNRVQGVENIRVIRLSPQEARIELAYRGTEQRLRLALEQSQIMLSQPAAQYAHYSGYDVYGAGGEDHVYDLTLNKARILQP